MASGRPAFGSRFNTGNMESALLARGFHYGSAPGSVVIGWNSGHAAVTLPDGTPVSSGESGAGVRIGGGGAYQPQFTRHMYLPVEAQRMDTPTEALPAPEAPPVDAAPAPQADLVSAPDAPPVDAPPPIDGAVVELTAAAPPAAGPPAPIDTPVPPPAPIDTPVPPPAPIDAPVPPPAPIDAPVPAPPLPA